MERDEFLGLAAWRLAREAVGIVAPELSHAPGGSGEPTLSPAPLADLLGAMAGRAVAAVSPPPGFPAAAGVGFVRGGRRYGVAYGGVEGRAALADAFAQAVASRAPLVEAHGPNLVRLVPMGPEDAWDAARQIDPALERGRFEAAWRRGAEAARPEGG